jgi:hypothetical protein
MANQAGESQTTTVDLQALERFVSENDELLELEERVGRFNIFDALRIVDREVKHSDFLAWLIDPNESHGQGGLFLRAILMGLLRTARENGFACPVSPVQLDGEELRGVEVRREWRNIDLLIKCGQPSFVVAVENKIRSSEHSNQLARYRESVQAEFGSVPGMYVFLTVDGDDPSEEDWVPYSYSDLHRVLERVRKSHEKSIGEDVRTFLDHYLGLIRGRLMDDPVIADLCQRIYKNHRRALQLIYEKAGSPEAGLIADVEDAVRRHPGGWEVVNTTSRHVFFVPKHWLDLLPAIGKRPTFDKRCWLVLRFEIRKNSGFFGASVWPTDDIDLRQRVVQRLTQDPKEFRFRLFLKTTSDKFSQLGRESIGTWSEEEGPDEEKVLESVRKKLDDLVQRVKAVSTALRPVIEAWQNCAK